MRASDEGVKWVKRYEAWEAKHLKPYALRSGERRAQLGAGFREYKTEPLEFRSECHRDRDRIAWCRAFKRLQHKTQIFPHYVHDHYRRRLTHSLEVSQIATTLARALRLNEVAAEAIALGHDLGHAPFGHAGERELNRIAKSLSPKLGKRAGDFGLTGFDHCVNGIEVVCRMEREYVSSQDGHPGLDLSFDVRDGILKHMRDSQKSAAQEPLGTVRRVTKVKLYRDYEANHGSLEAQCVWFADKLAYLLGDIEDGIRCGIFRCVDLSRDCFLNDLADAFAKERGTTSGLGIASVEDFLLFRRKAIAMLILQCIEATAGRLKGKVAAVSDVLGAKERLVDVPPDTRKSWDAFRKKWMDGCLYVNEDVMACEVKASKVVRELFEAYWDRPELIRSGFRDWTEKTYAPVGLKSKKALRFVQVRNYVAGMTDAFAIEQHGRLFMSGTRVGFA